VKLAYVISQFPETYETFILREFKEAERQGLGFTIFSLKKCRDKVVHPEARAFAPKTRPAGASAGVLFARNFTAALFKPVPFWGLFFRIFFAHLLKPRMFVKSLAGMTLGVNLAHILKKEKYTHMHAHWITVPATAALAASRMTGIPFSATAHAWDIFAGDNLLRHKVRAARFVATCTRFNKEHLEKILGNEASGKIFLNYHGLETPPAKDRPKRESGPLRLFSVGRLCETKGFPYLFDALKILAHEDMDFMCTIVGEGPLRGKLEKQLDSLGLAGRVKMPGVISLDNVWELYYQSDIFVLPCVVAKNGDRDGIPNVIAEAMAAGCPVVTTTVSGIPELVRDNETGLAVPEKDPPALADAIRKLAADPALGKRLAEAGQKAVEKMFNIERNVRDFIEHMRTHAQD
jgi:glycosyltransferase involved in cell wall biosynthesis